MITKVRLKNWKSHLDSEFDFTFGTNALLGRMGAGKSSCLDAICFALFGSFPSLQSKKIKIDDIIMKKPQEKDKAEVEVNFDLDGSFYSVKRVIEKRKGTTYSEIRENGKLLDAPNSQRVTEIVSKILKVNYELFSKAIYSEQNGIDYFLTIPKGQRMKKIDELLMIDKFEEARAHATSLINKIVERKIGKQSIVEKVDLDEIQSLLANLKKVSENLKKEQMERAGRLKEVSKERIFFENETNRLKSLLEIIENLRKEEKGKGSALIEVTRNLENLEKTLAGNDRIKIENKLEELSSSLVELNGQLKLKEKDREIFQEQYSNLKTGVEMLKKEKIEKLEKDLKEKMEAKEKIVEIEKEIGKDYHQKIKEKQKLVEDLVKQIEQMRVKIEDTQEILKRITSIEGSCPVCERKLNSKIKEKIMKQKKDEMKNFRKKIKELNGKKEITDSEFSNLSESAEKLEDMLGEIEDLDQVSSELEISLRTYEKEKANYLAVDSQLIHIRREIESMRGRMQENLEKRKMFEILHYQMKDLEQMKKRFGELLKERDEVKKHLAEHEKKMANKDLKDLETTFRDLIGKERELHVQVDANEQFIREKGERIAEYEKSVSEARKEMGEIEKLGRMIGQLKIFEKSLELTQIELRKEFVGAVNYTMDKVWHTFYPYQDFERISLDVDEGDYVLRLQEKSGRWINVDGTASGGERSLAALTLRIAFALVLVPHLRWIILDEPTHNLDSRAVEELARTLREKVNEFVDQVFLITHDEKLEYAVNGSLYKLEREKERDGATRVVPVSLENM